jgi:hypothetical protein
MTRNTPLQRFDVTIVEVIVHSACIEATGIVDANERARDLWDVDGPEAFHAQSLGRTDLIIANQQEQS